MQSMMRTWAGNVSNLKDAWTQLKGTIGEGLLPVLKTISGRTTEWLNQLAKSGVAERWGQRAAEGVEWLWGKLVRFGAWIAEKWPKLKAVFMDTWEGFRSGLRDLDQAGVGFGGLGTRIASIDGSLKSISESLKGMMDDFSGAAHSGRRAALWLAEALAVLAVEAHGAEYAFFGLAEFLNTALSPPTYAPDWFGFRGAAEQARRERERAGRKGRQDYLRLQRVWDLQDEEYGVQRPGGPRVRVLTPEPAASRLGGETRAHLPTQRSRVDVNVQVNGRPEMMRELLRDPAAWRAFEDAHRRLGRSAAYGAR
jgi:hypothetical protein